LIYKIDDTKLFSDLYLTKFLNILTKLFFPYKIVNYGIGGRIYFNEKKENYFTELKSNSLARV